MAVLSLLLVAEPALGASRRAQEKAARKACLAGDADKGVSILADLFVETRQPVYIFNQGRCFEQNRRYEDAIARFEEYLRAGETAGLSAEDRAAAEKHIADCKSRVPETSNKVQATAPPSFVPPPPSAAPIPEPVSTPQPAAGLVEQPQPQPEPPKGRSKLLTAGIIVGAVGVAAVGLGMGFNVKANSMVNDMHTKVDYYSENTNSSRESYQILAWVGYIGGAALVATGVVLVAVGASRGRSSQSVALVPTVGPDQAGMLLSGAF
jgi:hypothetical protein